MAITEAYNDQTDTKLETQKTLQRNHKNQSGLTTKVEH